MSIAETFTHDSDPPVGPGAWTPERIALLLEYREAKMRRRLIAEEINRLTGSNFTKRAICGKIDRLFPEPRRPRKSEEHKLAVRKACWERNNARKREKRRQARIAAGLDPDQPRRAPTSGKPTAPKLAVVAFNPDDFIGERVHGIVNLKAHHCRFMCNDDVSEPVWCGLPVVKGTSWCSGHRAIVFVPARSRAAPWPTWKERA